MKKPLLILSLFFVIALVLSLTELTSHMITENLIIPTLKLESRNMRDCGHGSFSSQLNHFLLLFIPAVLGWIITVLRIKKKSNHPAVAYQLMMTFIFLLAGFSGLIICVFKYATETSTLVYTEDLLREGYSICQLNWCLWGILSSLISFAIIFFIGKIEKRK